MKTARLLILAPILVLVVGSVAVDVGAAPPADGLIGCQAYATSNACKRKDVIKTSSSTWTAGVKSYMDNPVITINTIGWSWWTARETCNAAITYQQQYGGSTSSNASSKQDWSYHLSHSCSGTRKGWSMGNHDFHKSGYTHIYPYWEYWFYI